MIDADELPEGWALTTLGEVTEAKIRQAEPSGDSQDFIYIDIAAVDNIQKAIVEPKTLPVKDAPSRARQHVRPGDVLVSMTRPNLNAVAVVPGSLADSVASTGFHVLRPKEILPEWLFTIVRSTAFVTAMSELVQGALYPAVRPSDIRNYTIPLPPLAEQRRIVSKIEELAARSHTARAALTEVPTLLEQFRQSVLASAFRGDLTVDWRAKHPDAERTHGGIEPFAEAPETWNWFNLLDLCDQGRDICYGVIKLGDPTSDGVPCLRTSDVRALHIDTSNVKRIEPTLSSQYSRSVLQGGEVLVNVRGTLGGVSAVTEEMRGWNISREVAVVPVKGVIAEFLALWIASPEAQSWLNTIAKGVAYTGINIADLRKLAVPVPPRTEQVEIIDRANWALQRVAELERHLQFVSVELDALDQSILAKAISGELEAQNPSDEPATTLLARIRSGGSATTPATPTRSAKRGQVKAYILLLLRTWNKPLGREMVERGLVLMLNADVRRAILGRSKPATKPTKKRGMPQQFISGMDALLGEMIDDGQLVPGPEAGFFAEGQHDIDFAAAPPSDLDAVRETAEAMKVLHKDKQQVTDADIVSALNGEIYELVS